MGELESGATTSRKRKRNEETTTPDEVPEKKAKDFCCRTFRQSLKGNEALKSLKKFIAAAKNSDDDIFEYLECGGSIQEILSLIDATASGDLTTALPVFEVVHLILLRFQSLNSKHQERCLDSARTILRSHMITIKAMLSMNITKQKKVALKVLTAIATLDSTFANEIINVVALSPTFITDLIQPSSEKESVRKCFILFVLSFLVEGNLVVVKNLLDKKGFLGSIVPGLKFDDATTVNLTLSLFEDKILKNVKIPKTLKLKLFNTQIIKSFFDLYDWKGPQGVKQVHLKKKNKVKEVEINQSEKEIVIDSVHSFLMLLCCSQKHGVAFYDKSMGTSEQLNNQLLLTVFEGLSDPLKNKKIAEVLLKTTATCPDIMKPLLLKLEASFQPRNSKNWFQAMEFAENLIKAMDTTSLLKTETETLTPGHIIKVGKTLAAPIVFLRVVKIGSQKSQPVEIRFRSLKLLTAIWKEIEKLVTTFANFQELAKPLHKHVHNFLPDAGDTVELWHTLCNVEFFNSVNLPRDKKIFLLSTVLETLHVVVKCQRDSIASPLALTSDLLNHAEVLKDAMTRDQFDEIQAQIVQFVETDLENLTPQMELFEKSLLVLLKSTDDSSMSYLSKILASLEVFRENPEEVEIWLLCFTFLPREHRTYVSHFLIESIRLSFDEQTQPDRIDPGSRLLFKCIEVCKAHSSKSAKKEEKLSVFKRFVNDLIIHLQHFYTIDIHLYDYVKDASKIVGKMTLDYLKDWKNNDVKSPNAEVFLCPVELDLVSWLLNDERESQTIRDIVNVAEINLLRLYSHFRTFVAYLIRKISAGNLTKTISEKFVQGLNLFLCFSPEDEAEDVDLISNNVKNTSVYQRRCLDCLFGNEHLLKLFDVFEKKGENLGTALVFEVLMKGEVIQSQEVKRKLTDKWKLKFLKQLKAKLRKRKSIDGLEKLERVLNFFEYEHTEVKHGVELLMSVSDLDFFMCEGSPSAWAAILSKFISLHCRREELDESVLKKLCVVMKHLSENCTSNLDQMTECFVDLLRKHPSHLLLIENEFLEVVLLSNWITPHTSVLGKLLLNDPAKVRQFFNFVKENPDKLENPEIVFSLLSAVFVKENPFLNMAITKEVISVWKITEINPDTTPDEFIVLELVYKKFEKRIVEAIIGEKNEILSENLEFIRELVKLFLEGKKLSKVKKEILKGKLNPELALEAVKKMADGDVTESYMRQLLTLFCRLISQKNDDVDWTKHCSLVFDVIQLGKELSWQSLVGSSEWKEFAKLALGHCLSSSRHPSLLRILHFLFRTFYKSKEDKDCGLFFQMLISHSQFLKLILSHSPLKSELVELYRVLIERCPSEMSPKHFPILLASYTASLSHCDRTLLQVLRFYEKSGVGVSDYEPFVWGDTAVSHYSIGTSPGLSLWQRFNMGNVLDLLDGSRLELSLKEFPIRRGFDEDNNIADDNVYDPAFLLPLFVNLLSPGSVVFCLSFIYKGGLAYSVRALSSERKEVRLTALIVLTRFYNHLELSQNLKQKLVWMHFINCFRYGIKDLCTESLPNIATLFLARMTLELSRQPAELYLPLQNYLLAKFYFSFETVPEFLPLFHSSEVSYWKHREWLLQVIRDGTKTGTDINLIFHSMAPKILFCFFHSQLCDTEMKKLILQVTEKMLRIEKSILLISEYGLLNWITSIDSGSYHAVLHDLLNLLTTLTHVIVKDIRVHKSKHSNRSHLIQILNMAVKLLPCLKRTKSVETFETYLKLINECFLLFVKEGKSDWFKVNKNSLTEIVDTGVVLFGEENDFGKFSKVPFYFRDFNEECCIELKNCVFLFNLLSIGENKNK